MLHIGSIEGKQKTPLKYQYMKRMDAEIARRHFMRTMHWITVLAIIMYLVFAPSGFQVHHNLHEVWHIINW